MRIIESDRYGRLVSLVGSKHIPDVILHILGCRRILIKDLFTICLYFVINDLPFDLMYDLLELNPTFTIGHERELSNIWTNCQDYLNHPNWFTYIISRGGVYYIDGRKKPSRPILFQDCDPALVHEFFDIDFEWEEERLIWDPNYGNGGGYRMWRYDRELPDGAHWATS